MQHPVFILLFLPAICSAQATVAPVGMTDPQVMAYTAEPQVFRCAALPALLGKQKVRSMALQSEDRFGWMVLHANAGFVWPAAGGAFGVHAGLLTLPSFKQYSFRAGYGRTLGSFAEAGLQWGWRRGAIQGYHSIEHLSMEASVLLHPVKNLHVGLLAQQEITLNNGDAGHRPYQYRVGAGYNCSEQVHLVAEMTMDRYAAGHFQFGIEYFPLPRFRCSAGCAPSKSLLYWTAALQNKNYTCSITVSHHLQLGITPSLSVCYTAKKEKP